MDVAQSIFSVRGAPDGNCFFRALSTNIFGSQLFHFHIHLFLCGEVFRQRAQYITESFGFTYGSSSCVAYSLLREFAGFWGLNDPTESKLLLHLGEVFVMAEPAVYCSELFRQATANTLNKRICVYHPFTQLPHNKDAFEHYCPTYVPIRGGMAMTYDSCFTIMLTVSDSEVPKNLRLMALMDEHAMFNHWAVLVLVGADGGRTFDVPLSMFKNSEVVDPAHHSDQDSDLEGTSSGMGDVHFLNNDNLSQSFVQSVQASLGDNYFSVLSDEDNIGEFQVENADTDDEVLTPHVTIGQHQIDTARTFRSVSASTVCARKSFRTQFCCSHSLWRSPW